MTSEQHSHRHCLELFEKLSEYIDGELDEPTYKEMTAHLKACIFCRVCFETLKRSVDICRQTETKSMPTTLSKRINTLIQDTIAQKNAESPDDIAAT